MKSLAALVFVFWVLIASPMFCMGGVLSHACGCDEAVCSECQTENCQKSHGCHDDPCPENLIPPDQGDSDIGSLIAGQPATAVDVAMVDSANAVSPVLGISGFVPTLPTEFVPEFSSATATLPLLI